MTAATTRRLRIGVMLDSLEVNAWTYRILEDIARSDFCDISLAIINDRLPPVLTPRERLMARLDEWRRRGLFNRFQRWDRQHYRASKDAFASINAESLLPPSIRMRVAPVEKKYVDRFAEGDVAAIKQAGLDVIIRFGFRIIKGEILNSARYGVWSYHHGDNREYRGGPALFWEIYERNPVSGSVLQVLTEDLDAGHVLYRSWSATHFDSLHQNRNAVYWKTSAFVMRCLRDLQERGWDYLASRESQDSGYTKGIYRAPGNLVMAKMLARRAIKSVTRKAARQVLERREHWRVIVRPAGSWSSGDHSGEQHLVPPDDRFYADPFICKRAGRHYLFFEDYRFEQDKGLVSYVEIRPDGSFTEPEVVLERDYHLSYPFIFERNGEMYMIPETRKVNRIELYRATDFPRKWQYETTLMPDIAAVDATLHEADDRLWLFCNIAPEGASSCDELHVFYADSLAGPWTAHPCNPIVSDVRRARPAGRIFMHEGKLIRPAQDCSVCYGHAIQLNQIHRLTESEYREEPLQRITPEWLAGSTGVHTLNQNEDYEVLDAKFRLQKLRLPQWHSQLFGQPLLKKAGPRST